ncbi:MAG: V-type ATPase subunit [Peptoniphilaceae bacterium]|nr:V-type ATPase subunit [Peptoniphilaceae bacterium]MDD7383035.1 V-type ATPase subunit [Peptoniphilaceae bacterium]MDY3737786.1 V-type ATPase subunit [Peptoniphilaceae bacterium]
MRDAIVKSKAKLGKLPKNEDFVNIFSKPNLNDKLNYIKDKFNLDFEDYDLRKIELEILKKFKSDISSFTKYLNGIDLSFYNSYVSKYEMNSLIDVIQSIFNGTINENYKFLKENPFSDIFKIKKDMNFSELVNSLEHTKYYRVLKPFELSSNLKRENIMFLITNNLIKAYYRDVISICAKYKLKESKYLYDYIGIEIDLFNLETIYRLLRFYDIEKNEVFNYMIEGGKYIGTKELLKLSSLSYDEFISEISNYTYFDIFISNNNFEFISIERNLNRYIIKLSKRYLSQSGSDILKIVSAINIIYISFENLRRALEMNVEMTDNEKHILLSEV